MIADLSYEQFEELASRAGNPQLLYTVDRNERPDVIFGPLLGSLLMNITSGAPTEPDFQLAFPYARRVERLGA